MLRYVAGMVGIGLAASWATPINASVDATINLRAFVPLYCNIDLVPTAPDQAAETGVIDLGRSVEFCNAPHGYRIVLQHPADLVNATVISGAAHIPLSKSGETVLVDSDHPAIETRRLALALGKGEKIDRLGIRIEVNY